MKLKKTAVLTALSGAFAVGGFIVQILSSQDEEERIASRAAEILEEKKSAEE